MVESGQKTFDSTHRSVFFFFNDTATTEIYTLSLHDALPIWVPRARHREKRDPPTVPPHDDGLLGHVAPVGGADKQDTDRKSTRLNSSHGYISYAVFCLKKKNTTDQLPESSSHEVLLRAHAEP